MVLHRRIGFHKFVSVTSCNIYPLRPLVKVPRRQTLVYLSRFVHAGARSL